MNRFRFALIAILALCSRRASAQEFYNLTAEQVRIDTLLPRFACSFPLAGQYADSAYSVAIEYPEFIDMTEADVRRYKAITADTLPPMPKVALTLGVERKRGSLDVAFVPLVFRDGKYQKLVSFKLSLTAKAKDSDARRIRSRAAAASPADRYAAHSVLASGTWAKIRVPSSGVYHLSDEFLRRAGFSTPDRVKVYGYGGELQPETLSGDYLASTDDLSEVPTCTVGGRRLFYARGPLSWDEAGNRVRNPYSDYGYYFLTESDGPAATQDSTAFADSFYPSGHDSNALYEVDDFAWFQGGRNLYDSQVFTVGVARDYEIAATGQPGSGSLQVVLTAYGASVASVSVNDSVVGTVSVPASGTYDVMREGNARFTLRNVSDINKVSITQTSGGTMRLDYIALHCDAPRQAPSLSTASFPVPEYVHHITNQDLHADGPADMVVIIPTSQKLRQQAERLSALHEQADSMRVRIVPADELYNEFSSGTPDATAYRRYMKMLYDRAETEADLPKYLVLFGDGAWDNRMLSSDWRGYSADDYLLCFESENSYNHIDCYVSDDFYCLLDDGEAIQDDYTDRYSCYGKPDVAVGRIPVRTETDAAAVVDKIEAYMNNENAGSWQANIVLMGDDGNNNIHMETANTVADMVQRNHPEYVVKKIMWDAYSREASATGNSYPDVTRLIKQYMASGALIMNYNGHGVEYCLSHEQVVNLEDFSSAVSKNLPLWLTAACDILPFDGQEENIGEVALLNPNGGAVAFYGTTRTVYSNYNENMNMAFMTEVLDVADGRVPVGEAARRAKVHLVEGRFGGDVTVNKLQFTLLGDPAMKLALPTLDAVVDSINGVAVAAGEPVRLGAGASVVVKGRILDGGRTASDFDGTLTATVSDAEQTVTCKLNDTNPESGASSPFVFTDRSSVVFKGSDAVSQGQFTFTFAVPKDISYSDGTGLINLYAVSGDRSRTAGGASEAITLNGSASLGTDSIGPAIYCYLNSTSFTNGDCVNTTPYFVAEISDEDGINASGSGIGHDLQLSIDGEMGQTYVLNDYFAFDYGSYKSGTIGYSIPSLAEGEHTLRFRAWDILNNSSVVELKFRVARGVEPSIIDIGCTENPATTSTSFRIIHDRVGSEMDIVIDVFDMSGRHLWTHSESDVPADNVLTVDWDLTVDGGRRLGTGVYLYRVSASSDGSSYASKTKKLIIMTNK